MIIPWLSHDYPIFWNHQPDTVVFQPLANLGPWHLEVLALSCGPGVSHRDFGRFHKAKSELGQGESAPHLRHRIQETWMDSDSYPLVMTNIAIENDHRNSGFSHWKRWFSIVMLVYQRVMILNYWWSNWSNIQNEFSFHPRYAERRTLGISRMLMATFISCLSLCHPSHNLRINTLVASRHAPRNPDLNPDHIIQGHAQLVFSPTLATHDPTRPSRCARGMITW